MKKFILFFFLSSTFFSFAQKDSLQLGDKYADDQIYISVTYNQFFSQPTAVHKSGFSYGLSTGFMKDFILNKEGTLAVALGVGYGYNSFNHKLKVTESNNTTSFEVDPNVSNELFMHDLELPFELRWRSSTAKKYNFWRVYLGLKATYNLSNEFTYQNDVETFSFKNISAYNKWQYGLTLSAGYDAFNIHAYYGLAPIYKNATLTNESISTKILKIGLIFYIL